MLLLCIGSTVPKLNFSILFHPVQSLSIDTVFPLETNSKLTYYGKKKLIIHIKMGTRNQKYENYRLECHSPRFLHPT